MRVVAISHKPCWYGPDGAITTDGGFPMQMRALAELFDDFVVCVPVDDSASPRPGNPLAGTNLRVRALPHPTGRGVTRKLLFPLWTLRVAPTLLWEIHRADAVHAPIPGDVGTLGIVLSELLRKPLFVRHCGNWFAPRTRAERAWRWYMDRFGGGRRVMLATGGATVPPSEDGKVDWIFSTSLDEEQVRALACERSLPARDEPVRLLLAGRQVAAKGTPIAIGAISRLRDRWPLVMRVLGDGSDLSAFRRQAEDLGCADLVSFEGLVPHGDVLDALRWAHLFLLPTSSSEGFPKVVTESLAAGVPVVASSVGVLPLILDGCGIIVDPLDAAGVADALEHLLRDPERYRALSSEAVARARDLTLERWQEEVGRRLLAAWGPLRSDGRRPSVTIAGPLLGSTAGWVVSQGEILAGHLAEEGHAVITTSHRPRRLVRLVDTVVTVTRHASTTDVCLIMVFSGLGFVMADLTSSVARLRGVPVVFHLHGGDLPAFSRRHPRWVRRVFRRGRALVAPSPFLARELAAVAGAVRVIPNILAIPAAMPTSRWPGPPRILWMRTFHAIYRPELAVEAFRIVLRRHPTARLTMAGQEKGSGPAVRALIAEYGLVDQIDFPGFLGPAAKMQALAEHHVYLNTTAIDNAPVSVMEAAAYGLPIVATRVGGLADLLVDGESALLTGDSPAEIAAAVGRVLADQDLATSLATAGRAAAEAWSWPAVAAQWNAVLEHAVARRE